MDVALFRILSSFHLVRILVSVSFQDLLEYTFLIYIQDTILKLTLRSKDFAFSESLLGMLIMECG